MNIRIEKRVPFGFKGKWGKVYKLTNFNNGSPIIYQDNTYYDIGYDVQFKYLENGVDKSIINSTPIANLVTKGEFRLVKTTDAYFDTSTQEYECVVQPNDIIKVFGDWWICEKVEERSVYTPQKQTFYYLSLKKIFEEVLTNNEFNNTNATIIDVFNTTIIEFSIAQQNKNEIIVDWGDGERQTISQNSQLLRHTYNKVTNTKIKIFSKTPYELSLTSIKNIKNLELNEFVVGGEFTGSEIYNFELSTGITRLTTNMFSNVKKLKTLTIPSVVTRIDNSSCILCEDLENVEINANVLNLGGSMFYGCSKLKSVKLNDGLEILSAKTFENCIGLENITIPASVKSIGVDAFLNCPLKTIKLEPTTPPNLYSNGGITTSIEAIYIPQGTLSDYQTDWSVFANKFIEY